MGNIRLDHDQLVHRADRYLLVVRRPGSYLFSVPADRHFLDIQIGPSEVSYKIAGNNSCNPSASPSTFVFLPAGSVREITTSRAGWSIQLAFEPSCLLGYVPQNGSIRDLLHVNDGFLAQLCQEVARPERFQSLDRQQLDAIFTIALMRLIHHLTQTGPASSPVLRTPKRVQNVLEHIDQDLTVAHTVESLASVAGLSPYYFARIFREAMGKSPHRYVIERRVEEARRRLLQSEDAICSIAYDCGFASQSHMTTTFKRVLGVTPGSLRRPQFQSSDQIC